MRRKILVLALIGFCVLSGCASLPKPRPWTRTEKVMMGVSILAASADLYTTERMLDRGHYEINPVIGKYPTDTELVIKFPLCYLCVLALAHYWPEMRPGILGLQAMVNTGFAIHNSELE